MESKGALALLKPTLGGALESQGRLFLALGRSKENDLSEQSQKHAPLWASVLFERTGQ